MKGFALFAALAFVGVLNSGIGLYLLWSAFPNRVLALVLIEAGAISKALAVLVLYTTLSEEQP